MQKILYDSIRIDAAEKLKNTQFFLLILIAIALPWSVKLVTVAMGTATFLWIVSLIIGKTAVIQYKGVLFAFLFYFFLLCLSLLMSSNKSEGYKMIETRSCVLVLPLVLLMSNYHFSKVRIQWVQVFFALSVLILTAFTFREGLSFLNSGSRILTLENLLLMERPYLGIYCTISIVFLISLLKLKNSKWINFALLIGIIYLSVFVFIIISKNAVIGLLCTLIALLFIRIKNYNIVYTFILIGLLVATCIATYFISPKIKYIIDSVTHFNFLSYEKYNDGDIIDSFNKRFEMWPCAFDILISENHWLWGLGIGAEQPHLDSCYVQRKLPFMAQVHFNIHNQFLQDFLTGGIPLIFTLICIWVFPLKLAFEKSDYPFIGLLLILFIFSITESILLRQKGVTLYVFFTCLFVQRHFNRSLNQGNVKA